MSLTTPKLHRLASRALVAAVLASPALAGTLDRDNSTPTGWRWFYNVPNTTIDDSVSNGFRVVSLDVQSTSPLRFNVAMVANSGSYARSSTGWWFGTPDFVESKRAGRRVTALKPYVINNQVYFAASFVANTGNDQKTWGYYYGTWQAVASSVSAFNGRIVDLDSYVIGNTRYYTVVAVQNAGSDQKPWWVYLGVTPATIASNLSTNKARLIDLDEIGNGLYNAVMVRDTETPHWWWYYNATASDVAGIAGQTGSRVMHLEAEGSRYNAIFINNSNELTTRAGDALRKIPTGFVGAYLKQVGGPVLADLQGSRQYEPASSLKTLHLVTAMRDVWLNKIQLPTPIKSYIGSPTACPQTSYATQNEPLQTVLAAMMQNSDNTRTLTVEMYFGRQTMMNVAGALGMTKTQYNHSIGCGLPANTFTLEDAGKLFEAVAKGYVGAQKNNFYSLMSNNTLASTIDAEAAKLVLPAPVVTAFKSYVMHVWKGGSYGVSGVSHRSHVGWFRLPFRANNKVELREFVYGVFCNDVENYGNNTAAYDQFLLDGRETLRAEMVYQALKTWKDSQIDGIATPFGSGCAGSNGTVSHVSSGTPEIGNTQSFVLRNGPSSGAAIMHIGFSKGRWGALPLPLDLTPFGARGCTLYSDPTIPFAVATSAAGSASYPFRYPNLQSLLGHKIYTQYLCLDSRSNSLGLTLSNGIETLIGGWPQ